VFFISSSSNQYPKTSISKIRLGGICPPCHPKLRLSLMVCFVNLQCPKHNSVESGYQVWHCRSYRHWGLLILNGGVDEVSLLLGYDSLSPNNASRSFGPIFKPALGWGQYGVSKGRKTITQLCGAISQEKKRVSSSVLLREYRFFKIHHHFYIIRSKLYASTYDIYNLSRWVVVKNRIIR
jgi:hypothetical protein